MGRALQPKGATAGIRPAETLEAGPVSDRVRASYAKYAGRIGREPTPMLMDCAAAIEAGGARVLVGRRRVFTRKLLGLPHKSGAGEGAGA